MLAELLDRELIRLQCYEGIDASQALYEWNYSRQLIAVRAMDAVEAEHRRRGPVRAGVPRGAAAARRDPRGRPRGPAGRRARPRRRRVRGVPAGDPVGVRGRRSPRSGQIARRDAARRDRHVEPDARAARRAEAPMPLPLDRPPRSGPRGRDRARPRAARRRGARARRRRRRSSGCATLDLAKVPGRRRDDRLGERARVPRRRAARRRARGRHARRRREGPRGPGAGRRRAWPRWSGRMPDGPLPPLVALGRDLRAGAARRHRPDPHVRAAASPRSASPTGRRCTGRRGPRWSRAAPTSTRSTRRSTRGSGRSGWTTATSCRSSSTCRPTPRRSSPARTRSPTSTDVSTAATWQQRRRGRRGRPRARTSALRLVASAVEVLRSKSFAYLNEEERQRVAKLIRELRVHVPIERTRRTRSAHEGADARRPPDAPAIAAHPGRAVRSRVACPRGPGRGRSC